MAIPGGLVILEMARGGNTVPLLKNEDTRHISALMPSSVSVYAMSDGRVMISRLNGNLMAGMLAPRGRGDDEARRTTVRQRRPCLGRPGTLTVPTPGAA